MVIIVTFFVVVVVAFFVIVVIVVAVRHSSAIIRQVIQDGINMREKNPKKKERKFNGPCAFNRTSEQNSVFSLLFQRKKKLFFGFPVCH